MFLLIRLLNAYPITKFCSLNSIMFLLIQISKRNKRTTSTIFKFHYVSINSPVSVPWSSVPLLSLRFHYVSINSGLKRTGCCGCPFFKFHYVSINSKLTFSDIEGKITTLNSIMFLLIRLLPYNVCNQYIPLNSIMFPINSIMAVKQLNK